LIQNSGFRQLSPDYFDESARIAAEPATSAKHLAPAHDESDERGNSNDDRGTALRHHRRDQVYVSMPSEAESSGYVDHGMGHAAQERATQTSRMAIHRMHQFPEFE
jgi:hypothetical protein